ncbi:MAG: hypothetical protein LBV59_04785 [Sphingobacterium sp.]|jgi:hypothetical protein|uniref:hypothetical protein n=1 Tax=Sphingobacterium sp. TaxID=341027 RepID=UPI00284EDF82|nr:hypothetical protein [Sphingobacterium sp.]MDR3007225.1 hypothetical protein [Sphingobacterium sp.]
MATIKFKSSGESEFVLEINTETSREASQSISVILTSKGGLNLLLPLPSVRIKATVF